MLPAIHKEYYGRKLEMGESQSLALRENGIVVLRTKDGEESYSLAAEPAEKSSLVQSSRKEVLQTISLGQMFKNLDTSVTLLDIAYNAVNGMEGGLSPKVTQLQSSFLDTLSDSLVITQGFEAGARTTVMDLIAAYKYLTLPKYAALPKSNNGVALARKVFDGIQKKAALMEKDAGELADSFKALKEQTVGANQLIIGQKDIDYKKRDEKLAEMNRIESQIDGLQQVKEELETEIADYTDEYSKISKRAEQQEKDASKLALVSAIMSGVSGILGSLIPLGSNKDKDSAAGGSGGDAAPGGSPSADGAKSDGIQSKYDESEKKAKKLKDALAESDGNIAEIKKKLEGAEGDEAKQALTAELDAAAKEREKTQKELDSATSQSEVYKQALGGLADGLNVTSGKFDAMAKKADDKAESLYNRLDKIAAQKAAVSKERRETIQQLASLTKSIEFATTEKADLDVAINALITAVGCMRLVEVYLSDIALFWRNVKEFCKRIIEQIESINSHTANFADVENYIEFFNDEDFAAVYLLNIASWVALRSICAEYVAAFNNAYTQHKAAIGQAETDRKEHWKHARELAKSMSAEFERQLLTDGND
jgi:DNA repair exonuclease SbcCD ATPase subunit